MFLKKTPEPGSSMKSMDLNFAMMIKKW